MRPPVGCLCRHRKTESHQTTSCRLLEPLDLERNSADAIAPAMTSSVLLHHRSAVEPWSKAPRKPAGRNNPAFALESLNPNHEPGGESVQLGPLASRRRLPLPRRLSGEGTFRIAPFGRPGTTTWKRTVLPYLVDVKRKTPTYCILPQLGVTRKGNGGGQFRVPSRVAGLSKFTTLSSRLITPSVTTTAVSRVSK